MRLIYLLFIVYLYIIGGTKSYSQIVFNEILASNSSTNLSSVSKNYDDWIELHNTSNSSIEMGGWYLTDNLEKPTKWKFPYYISAGPKSYLVFWADGKNFSDHLNFKLDSKGESIYLFTKDTVLVDSLNYSKQKADISFGRKLDTPGTWGYFYLPTPGKANSTSCINELNFCDSVKFSIQAGFHKKPIKVELTTKTEEEELYYTLDGSIPTEKSLSYNNPIIVKETSVIRARCFKKGKLPGPISTSTYLIKEKITLPVISLSVNPDNLWSSSYGIYVPGPNFNPKKWQTANYFKPWERPINIEYFDLNGLVGFNVRAGVKIHGQSTRNFPQKSFGIFFKDKYGTCEVNYKIFPRRNYNSYKSFLLRSSGNDWGITMFHDAMIHTLVNQKIDMDAQSYQPAIVFLNGKYWGIHNIREKINSDYLKNLHGIDSKNVDIIETYMSKLEPSDGDMSEYNKLMDLVKSKDMSTEESYSWIRQKIDIEEFINYHILQVFIANSDFPAGNMKLWRERKEGAKWRCILYDTEYSFGHASGNYKSNVINALLEKDLSTVFDSVNSNYLIRRLFENKDFENEFAQRTAVYLNTIFHPDRITEIIDSLKSNINDEVKRNLIKWGGRKQNIEPYYETAKTTKDWEQNIGFLKKFGSHRGGYLRKNFMKQFAIKDTLNLRIKVNNTDEGKIRLMGYVLPEGKFNGLVFSDIPIRIEAIPNEGYEFVKWKEEELDRKCSIVLTSDKKLTAIFRKL